jgi:hypothetical protein
MTDFTSWHAVLLKLAILLAFAFIYLGTRRRPRGATRIRRWPSFGQAHGSYWGRQ